MTNNENITMSKKELNRGKIIIECIAGKYTIQESSKLLNLSCRQICRMKSKVKKYGVIGLAHKSRKRESNRKIPDKIKSDIAKIIRDNYCDFKPTFAREKLVENHNIVYGIETIRQIMISNKIWVPKTRKKNNEHREWRTRKEHMGDMIQYDGSYHNWFENRIQLDKLPCLLAAIDDATGKIMYAKFDNSEGVVPTMKFWTEYFKINGKPNKIYLDRGSTYKKNRLNLYKILTKEEELTQFERACDEVSVKLIHATSPQGKGRVERLFGTLQDRLVKEMRLANINSIKQANEFLIDVFIPRFNEKFSVLPLRKANFHKQLSNTQLNDLFNSFCIKDSRIVMNDFTVQYKKKYYQILKEQKHRVLRKSKVTVKAHLDNTIELEQKGFNLNFKPLLEKPIPKKKVTVSEIKKKMKKYIPPRDHPWRKPFPYSKRYYQINTNLKR
jgi:hypothetical protein